MTQRFVIGLVGMMVLSGSMAVYLGETDFVKCCILGLSYGILYSTAYQMGRSDG